MDDNNKPQDENWDNQQQSEETQTPENTATPAQTSHDLQPQSNSESSNHANQHHGKHHDWHDHGHQQNQNNHHQEPHNGPLTQQTELAHNFAAAPSPSSATTAVWQWLTYSLWIWTLGTLSVLIASTLAYFIANADKSTDFSWLVYVIAASLCLLPISYLVDKSYQKNEPTTKQGFAAVILVIHAVFAFLVSVGSLITAIVTALSFATDVEGDSATKTTVIISAVLISLLGGLLFARITRPTKFTKITTKFSLIVLTIATITIVAALAGPYAATIGSKKDRLLESGLYNVNYAIQNYASANQKLPASLDDLTFETYYKSGETLVKKKLVTYNPTTSNDQIYGLSSSRTFRYELCVDYKKAKGTGVQPSSTSSDYNSSYIDTSSHPAGHTCYQQSTYSSSYSNPSIVDGTNTLDTQTTRNDASQN